MLKNEQLRIEPILLAGIPCLSVRSRASSIHAPTVFLYHGWVSRKERLQFLAGLFAQEGYQVIVPDAYLHGERGGNLDYRAETRHRYFWDVVIRTVEEGGALIQAAIEQGYARAERMAVVGESMGGFIASGIFARQPGLKCLVSMNGSAAWEYIEHQFRRMENRPKASEQELVQIRKHDPLQHLDKMVRRPILILHGDADTIMPIDSEREFIQKAAPFYADCPEKLKFEEFPRLNHYVSYGMLEQAFLWIGNYL